MNEERMVMQAIVVVKAMWRTGAIETPLSVELSRGTSAEDMAWRREAEKYLKARHEGVKYKPDVADFEEMLQ